MLKLLVYLIKLTNKLAHIYNTHIYIISEINQLYIMQHIIEYFKMSITKRNIFSINKNFNKY